MPTAHTNARVRDYKGTWINTNMQSHSEMAHQVPYEVLRLASPDGLHVRKLGLIGVLSDSASLYRANAFGGAKIEDPYDTIAAYKAKLEGEEGCDLVIPLQHLYVPQDIVTCKRFDFPVVLSGHDHHVVDEVHHGTRLLKAGSDAKKAICLDITWATPDDAAPTINAEVLTVADYAPDAALARSVTASYSVLDHLKHTQLCEIPRRFRPLSSDGARARPCTAATFLLTCVRTALNADDLAGGHASVHGVLVSGGNIRGGKTYAEDAFFSMEDLQSEIQEALEIVIVHVPGHVLSRAITASRGEPNPGYIQHDDGLTLDATGRVAKIAGQLLQPDKVYRIATTLWDLCDGTSAPLVDYFSDHFDKLPDADASYPVRALLLQYFADDVWRQILARLDSDGDGTVSREELLKADADQDGRISRDEVAAMMTKLGVSVDGEESGFIDTIMKAAGDKDGDGYIAGEELSSGVRAVTPKVETPK